MGRRRHDMVAPSLVLLLMKFLAQELARCRVVECPTRTVDLGEGVQFDAKADNYEVASGGWCSFGVKETAEAPWSAAHLDHVDAPGALVRGEACEATSSREVPGGRVG